MSRKLTELGMMVADSLNGLANNPPSEKTANDIRVSLSRLASLIPEIVIAIDRINEEIDDIRKEDSSKSI